MSRLDRLLEKFCHLVGVGNIKLLFKHPTYLQVIPPLLGFFYFIRHRGKIFPAFYPFLIMISCGVIPVFLQDAPLSTLLRLIQLFLLVGFSHFVATYFDQQTLKTLLWSVFIASLVLLGFEIGTGSFPYQLKRFGLILPRSAGIVGEPNFSGVFYLGLIMIGWCANLRLIAIGLIFSLIATLSRGSCLALLIFFLLLGLQQLLSSREKFFAYSLQLALGLFCAYPLLWSLLDKFLVWEWKLKLVRFSARYYLHVAYIQLGLSKLFGHGVMVTPKKVADFIESNQELKTLAASSNDFDYGEQHNFFLQIFSDFGPVTYLLFCLFLFLVLRRLIAEAPKLGTAFVALMFNFIFLNGGNEIIFYFTIGVIFSNQLKS